MEKWFLYPDHLEIISGIGLLQDLKSSKIFMVLLIYSWTVTVLSFNAMKTLQIISLSAKAGNSLNNDFSNHDYGGRYVYLPYRLIFDIILFFILIFQYWKVYALYISYYMPYSLIATVRYWASMSRFSHSNYWLIIDVQSLSKIYISWSNEILLQDTLYHALLS